MKEALFCLVLILLCPLRVGADKIHVLEQISNWKYRTVIHSATPGASNASGFTFVSILAAVKAQELAGCTAAGGTCTGSVLKVGTLPGEILQAELDAIVAGTTMEVEAILLTGSCGETPTCANGEADKVIAAEQVRLQVLYKRYGEEIN